jgi:hypothetical protein
MFQFYQALAIDFANELEILIPPKYDPNALISPLA